MKNLILRLLRVKWVAFTSPDEHTPELGISILGIVVGLYKGHYYIPSNPIVRRPEKREFGESIRPH